MSEALPAPTEAIAAEIVRAMTGEQINSTVRLTTGDASFIYAVDTAVKSYVLKLSNQPHFKNSYASAIYWQEKLAPLGVPLAPFIHTDLDGKFSPYPALLMPRLPGDDLINQYPLLTSAEKRVLAEQIVAVHASVATLPTGRGFGFARSYEMEPAYTSWYDFILARIQLATDFLKKPTVFNEVECNKIHLHAAALEGNLRSIAATPFLWDASERNVLVQNDTITGIVDVEDLCFGDPLWVLALTYAALEVEGLDTVYPDAWASILQLDDAAKQRLNFYRLFYAVAFMRKHDRVSTNDKHVMFNVATLQALLTQALRRLEF